MRALSNLTTAGTCIYTSFILSAQITTETPQLKHAPPSKSPRTWPWLLALVLAGAGYYYYPQLVPNQKAAPADAGKKAGAPGGRAGARQVPVVAAAARRGDMPVYLDGLGSVIPLNTVTVHSRVDGELVNVAFTEGQMVKQGDLLAEIDPRPFNVQFDLAQATKARDESLLANARMDLDRYKVLMDRDAVPKQQLDTQAALVNQYIATVQADQANIDNAKLQQVYSRITSPLTGRIGLRLVDRGNIVHATDVNGLAVVAQVQPITVVFNIPEDSLPRVRERMKNGSKLPVLAYDRDLKHKLADGSLLTIDNQIDQTSGTVRFKAIFENDDLSLFPNQFVNARLLLDVRRGIVIVPSAAIQHSPGSAFVYRVKEDQSVEVRNVTTSLAEGDETAIDSGLETGDVVVIDGIDRLERGTKVVVRMAGPKK
jgi:multidrug efflux system membrane fusion protein